MALPWRVLEVVYDQQLQLMLVIIRLSQRFHNMDH